MPQEASGGRGASLSRGEGARGHASASRGLRRGFTWHRYHIKEATLGRCGGLCSAKKAALRPTSISPRIYPLHLFTPHTPIPLPPSSLPTPPPLPLPFPAERTATPSYFNKFASLTQLPQSNTHYLLYKKMILQKRNVLPNRYNTIHTFISIKKKNYHTRYT